MGYKNGCCVSITPRIQSAGRRGVFNSDNIAALVLLAMNIRKRLLQIDQPLLPTDQSFTELNAFAVIARAVFCAQCCNTRVRYFFYRCNTLADVITLDFPEGKTGRIVFTRQHRDQLHGRGTELITLVLPLGAEDQRTAKVDAHRFVTMIEDDIVPRQTDDIPVRQPGIHREAALQLAIFCQRIEVFGVPYYQF